MIDRSKILATSFHLLNLNRTHVLLEATYWSPTQLCKRRCLSELCLKSCSRLPMARMLASACLAPTFALLQTPTMGLKYSRKRFEQLYSSLNKSKQFPATLNYFFCYFQTFLHTNLLNWIWTWLVRTDDTMPTGLPPHHVRIIKQINVAVPN